MKKSNFKILINFSSVVIGQKLSQGQLEFYIVEHSLPENHVLSKELLRIWWIRNKRKQRIEQMIKDLNNTCLSNGARFEIFHSIFSGQINSFHLGHRIAHLRCLFVCKSLVCFLALRLEYVNFITNKNFNGDFTGSLAFCYPLFNSFKSGSLCHIKEVNYRS